MDRERGGSRGEVKGGSESEVNGVLKYYKGEEVPISTEFRFKREKKRER
jgi:hypothetical protein